MKYVVIDEDGQLRQRTAPNYNVALRDVGPEGWDRVRLHNVAALFGPEQIDMAAFLNDCGLVMPDRYGRNVVGTCVLASFGAGVQPYAGPIVLTGWDPSPDGDDAEIESLTEMQVDAIRVVHADVRRVLGLDPGSPAAPARWQAAMREVADVARTAPTPGPVLLTGEDALMHLRRAGRHA
jgi:hypothetical protein